MFKNKVIRLSTLLMLLAIGVYFVLETFVLKPIPESIETNEKLNPETYVMLAKADRRDLLEWYKTSEDSPIKDKENFTGLDFYDISIDYRVVAKVVPYAKKDKSFEVAYTDGTNEVYEKYAYLEFEINGKPERLLLLKQDGTLSLMFKDATSGKTTYGGGRYLDFPESAVKGGYLVVDFNKAYSPYCAFDPGYGCPLPPAENVIVESILAGEKYTAEK